MVCLHSCARCSVECAAVYRVCRGNLFSVSAYIYIYIVEARKASKPTEGRRWHACMRQQQQKDSGAPQHCAHGQGELGDIDDAALHSEGLDDIALLRGQVRCRKKRINRAIRDHGVSMWVIQTVAFPSYLAPGRAQNCSH